MKGRKPDPKAPKRGTARHRKTTAIVPVEYSGAITPTQAAAIPLPTVLPRTQAVLRLWCDLLREVARTELRVGDLPGLESICVAAYRKGQAGRDIKRNGIWIDQVLFVDESGVALTKRIKNPMLKEERDQAMLLDRLSQRFGFSPESRVRLKLMELAGDAIGVSLSRELEGLVSDRMARVHKVDGEYVIDGEATEITGDDA
jgi:phage terminase small subunit